MSIQKTKKPKFQWAIFRCGYYLVCPTYTLALVERRNKERPIKVIVKEVK